MIKKAKSKRKKVITLRKVRIDDVYVIRFSDCKTQLYQENVT